MVEGTIIKDVQVQRMQSGELLMNVQYADGRGVEIRGYSLYDLDRQDIRAFNHWDRRNGHIIELTRPDATMIPILEKPVSEVITNEAFAY